MCKHVIRKNGDNTKTILNILTQILKNNFLLDMPTIIACLMRGVYMCVYCRNGNILQAVKNLTDAALQF